MSNEAWHDDSIQFPRLLSEIAASQDLNIEEIASDMDLSPDEVNQLFNRAHAAWEEIKARTAQELSD